MIKLFFFIIYGKGFREEADKRDYHHWIRINERQDAEGLKQRLGGLRLQPKISVIVPVYNVAPQWLDRCIRSVETQIYENWELCLYDDASSEKMTIDFLKQLEGKGDPTDKNTVRHEEPPYLRGLE